MRVHHPRTCVCVTRLVKLLSLDELDSASVLAHELGSAIHRLLMSLMLIWALAFAVDGRSAAQCSDRGIMIAYTVDYSLVVPVKAEGTLTL